MWIWIIVLLGVVLLAYVRLAPTDVTVVHKDVVGTQDHTGAGSCLRVVDGDAALFARIDGAMRALPRTQVVAGSVGEGRVTYVTRSQMIGFPDYTTVALDGAQIKMFARLRFGKSDLGVNRARLDHVLKDVDAG